MCGLTGFWDLSTRLGKDQGLSILSNLSENIITRGPDSSGSWYDEDIGIGLAHRRLAIMDPSPNGHQPMMSASGLTFIAYNGEIYNAPELRKQLARKGIRFRSSSDTEVLLEGCELWGVSEMIKRCNGMFAFALWNAATKTLYLARDRLGVKPLFWGKQNNAWFFGSQLSAIAEHPLFTKSISSDGLSQFIRYAYIPSPCSIYQDIKQVEPGQLIEIRESSPPISRKYWDIIDTPNELAGELSEHSLPELATTFSKSLRDSIRSQMLADVPLGAFLSGGIDSAVIVSMMQDISSMPVKTFTIGFDSEQLSEASQAKAVSDHLGTEHHEVIVTGNAIKDMIPGLSSRLDQPLADVSQLPTQILCELTSRHVKVALSGDGGDEIFGGYNRYIGYPRLKLFENNTHRIFSAITSTAIRAAPPSFWDQAARILPKSKRPRELGDKLYKIVKLLNTTKDIGIYRSLLEHDFDNTGRRLQILNLEHAPPIPPGWSRIDREAVTPIHKMQLLDISSYLPDNVLTKVDRASMTYGLEVRVPFLDHTLVELSQGIPDRAKIGGGQGKLILRHILKDYLPESLIGMQKAGFTPPVGDWLKGPLRDWAQDQFSKSNINKTGVFDFSTIQSCWMQHLSGKGQLQYLIWNVLMAQSWLLSHASDPQYR